MNRVVTAWTGGGSAHRQFSYRVVQLGDGSYVLEVKPLLPGEWEFRAAGRFEHLLAHRLAAHFIIEDKERLARQEEWGNLKARRMA